MKMKRLTAAVMAGMLLLGHAAADWECSECGSMWADKVDICDECGMEAPLRGLRVTEQGTDYLQLSWLGYDEDGVDVKYRPASSQSWRMGGRDLQGGWCCISGLTPDTAYVISLQSADRAQTLTLDARTMADDLPADNHSRKTQPQATEAPTPTPAAQSTAVPTVNPRSGLNMDYILQYPSVYCVDIQQENAFVSSSELFPADLLSFNHRYESSMYYSLLYTDILILDYFQRDACPLIRMWMVCSGTKAIDPSSIAFTFAGKTYTFYGLETSTRSLPNSEVQQEVCILFDSRNQTFLLDLYQYIDDIRKDETSVFEALRRKSDVTMSIIGNETIQVQLNEYQLTNFSLMMEAFANLGDVPTLLNAVEGDALRITTAR